MTPDAGAGGHYAFRRVRASDLPLVASWLELGHVRAWWGDPAEQLELIAGDLDEPSMACFLVETDGVPFAYVQAWDPHAWGEFGDQPAGVRGIDSFIGPADMIGLGHGGRLLRAFCDRLFAAGASRAIVDPDPANARAIRSYAKAGFRPIGERPASDGPVLLMARDAETTGHGRP